MLLQIIEHVFELCFFHPSSLLDIFLVYPIYQEVL